jgi:iron complex transport system substrate-binding protein
MIRTLVGVVLALALIAAACGDDAADTTITAPSAPATTAAPSTTTSAPPTTLREATAAPSTTTPDAITFVGADGVETVITDTSRIVSLNGDITEILFALGVGGQIVAVDVTTTYPEATESLPRIGFAQDLAPEPVLAFEPTLVIGDELIAPAGSIEQLRRAGVPVAIIPTRVSLDEVEQKIIDVATVAGAANEGRQLAATVAAEIDAVRDDVAGIESPVSAAFLYSRGPGQVFLFGAGNVSQAMIEGAGAIDVVAANGIPGVLPLTPEALVAAAPEVLILPASGVGALGGIEGVLALPGVAETPAGRSQRFLVYDDGLFLNFGPRTGEALARLAADLYPELGS